MPAISTIARAKFDRYLIRSFIRLLSTNLPDYKIVHGFPASIPENEIDTVLTTKKGIITVTLGRDLTSKKKRATYKHYYDGSLGSGDPYYRKKQIATGETLFGEFDVRAVCKTNEPGKPGLSDTYDAISALRTLFLSTTATAVYNYDTSVNTSMEIRWDADGERSAAKFGVLPVPPDEYQTGYVTLPFFCDYYVLENHDVVTEREIVAEPEA